MAARPGLEDAAKAGLMKAELLLDRFGSQTDLPADLPLSCRTTAVDQRQLDAVSLVQAQPVEIGGWEMLAPTACCPEFLYRTWQIDRHNGRPQILPTPRRRLGASVYQILASKSATAGASTITLACRTFRPARSGLYFKTTETGSPYIRDRSGLQFRLRIRREPIPIAKALTQW